MAIQVLIVDDNEGVLFLHELMVEESGLSDDIKTFNSAEKALTFLDQGSSQDFKTIFLDLNMPGMSGWDFINHISGDESYKYLKVIIVTSSINKSDKIISEKYSQIIGFIEKPLSLEDCVRLKESL